MSESTDIVVIGAGMAGSSLAAHIAKTASVIVLEAEERPGMHATGRSAALYAPGYGNWAIRVLTRASEDTLRRGPSDSALAPFITPRNTLMVATVSQLPALAAMHASAPEVFSLLSGKEAEALVPVFRPGRVVAALGDYNSADIDVNALHQHYLRALRVAGGIVGTFEPPIAIEAEGSGWRVTTAVREIRCKVIVNAAGAWSDKVAVLAGVPTVGLQPKRRTAALIDAPAYLGFADWPVVIDIDERFYFKPDAGRLLISPAEETDVEPHDAFADDEALAEGVERIADLTTIQVTRAPRAWAGLRTFVPDRTPVIGFEPNWRAPFFWLAGQGGYGIQSAPAIAELACSLICGRPLPSFASEDLVRALSPSRFRPINDRQAQLGGQQ
jgi:D-arginine dehydrogenase